MKSSSFGPWACLLACACLVTQAACGDDSVEGTGATGPVATPTASSTSVTGGEAATSGSGGSGGAGGDVSRELQEAGFLVQEGDLRVIDLSSCCDEGRSCAGNNPTSPYGAFYVPPSPAQTVTEEAAGEDGTANAFRMRGDEAIVWVGTTPPAAAYFGLTAYIVSSVYDGERRNPFASLGETLNSGVVADALGEAFSAPVAVILTPDAGTDASVRAALDASGIASSAIFSIPIDPSAGTLGLDEDASTYGVLLRVALFEDEGVGSAYLADIPGAIFRVTPAEPAALDPKPPPPSRAKDDDPEAPDLDVALDALEDAVRAAYPDATVQTMALNAGTPDPEACIANGTGCAGDNRDTNYPTTLPQALFEDGERYVVLGVDHRATGKTAYSNVSVYALDHLVGITGVSDRDWAGTAESWIPDEPLAAQLFAWTFARACDGDGACTEIPVGTCPDGLAEGGAGTMTFRTYLEPGSHTAPAVETLVPFRVLRVRP